MNWEKAFAKVTCHIVSIHAAVVLHMQLDAFSCVHSSDIWTDRNHVCYGQVTGSKSHGRRWKFMIEAFKKKISEG